MTIYRLIQQNYLNNLNFQNLTSKFPLPDGRRLDKWKEMTIIVFIQMRKRKKNIFTDQGLMIMSSPDTGTLI